MLPCRDLSSTEARRCSGSRTTAWPCPLTSCRIMTTTNGQDGIVAHPHTTVLRAPTGHFTLSSIHNRSDMAARVNTHVEQTLLSVQRHTSGNTCAGSPKDSPVRPPATLLSQHRQECLCYISASLARFKKRRSHSHALLRRRSASYTGAGVPTRPP